MKRRSWVLAETNWREVSAAKFEVAILPWGATEAHNYHLPYGTDVFECDFIAAETAKLAYEQGAKIIVLPTIPFGVNTGQLDIPLCVNMNPSTQAAVLGDVAHSLESQGIKKLVILNGHGGNDFRQMIRELQPRTSVFLATINWWQVVDPSGFFEEPGDHGGELETSVMLHCAPDLVSPLHEAGSGTERRPKIAGFREGWAWAPRRWTAVTLDTGIGNPKAATAEKGARYSNAVVDRIAGFLVELARTNPAELYE